MGPSCRCSPYTQPRVRQRSTKAPRSPAPAPAARAGVPAAPEPTRPSLPPASEPNVLLPSPHCSLVPQPQPPGTSSEEVTLKMTCADSLQSCVCSRYSTPVLFRGILDESLLQDSDLSAEAEEQATALPGSGNPSYHASKYPWPCQRQDDIPFYQQPGGHQQSLAGNSEMKYKCQPCYQPSGAHTANTVIDDRASNSRL